MNCRDVREAGDSFLGAIHVAPLWSHRKAGRAPSDVLRDYMVDGCRTYERPISLWCDQSGIERAEHLSDRIGNGARDPGRHEGIALARWRDVNDLEILVEGRSEHSCHLSNRVRRVHEVRDLADGRGGTSRV